MSLTEQSAEKLAHPTLRTLVPILVILVGFCAICAHVLVQAHTATRERAIEAATSLIAAIKSEVSRNIETLDLSLQGVVDNLKYPGLDRIDPRLRQLVLFDRSTTARHLGAMLVLDEKGDLIIDSRTVDTPALNFADRDYFQVHKNNDAVGTFIGRPAIARTAGEWFVGVSRRLSHPDGSFAGVVMASLRLAYFQQLLKDIALAPNSSAVLTRTDGTVVMRWPFKEQFIGFDLSNSQLYERLARSPSGVFDAYSKVDGVHRVISYSQIGDLPLVIGVGQATDEIYRHWRDYALAVSVLIGLLSGMTIVLGLYLARELKRRTTAEHELAALANSDALTGLSNRRHFNETLNREWQRCTQEGRPIALLMIDVDFFKPYNDSNGHQGGDQLLQTIGSTIAGVVTSRRCLGARFGGDEFAILLPGASAAEAAGLALEVRQKYSERCRQAGVVATGLSIGLGEIVPRAGDRQSDLVRFADDALYRAKQAGRNRTEILSTAAHKPEPWAA